MNTMKKYSLIIFLLLSQFPGAVFALEECPGSQSNYRNWTNCKGTFTRANGDQYEGEWKYSKADGLGTKTWLMETNTWVDGRMTICMDKALSLTLMETNTRVSGRMVKQFGQGAFLIKFIHLRLASGGYGDCDVFILA